MVCCNLISNFFNVFEENVVLLIHILTIISGLFPFNFWLGNVCTWIASWSLAGTRWEDEHGGAGATDWFQVQELCSRCWQSTEELWIFQWMGRFNISTWEAKQGMPDKCSWKGSGIAKGSGVTVQKCEVPPSPANISVLWAKCWVCARSKQIKHFSFQGWTLCNCN